MTDKMPAAADNPADAASENSPSRALLELLRCDSDYTDLAITCGTHGWHAHMAILCSQSEWFKDACSPSGCMNKSTNVIYLPGHAGLQLFGPVHSPNVNDEDLITDMLDFFYTLYDLSHKPIKRILELSLLARHYKFPTMEEACQRHITLRLQKPMSTVYFTELVEFVYQVPALHAVRLLLVRQAVDVHCHWLGTEAGQKLLDRVPQFGKDTISALSLGYDITRKPQQQKDLPERRRSDMQKSKSPRHDRPVKPATSRD